MQHCTQQTKIYLYALVTENVCTAHSIINDLSVDNFRF
jgi:hypothetical protein